MSSFRNAEKQRSSGREHKERRQLKSRQKLGLLEKHKDYVLRARDYHRKERRINALKEKAAFRNPDEFYFGMVNAQTEGGVHKAAPKAKITVDMMKTLTDKDIAFLETKRVQEMKKVARMKESLHFIGATPKAKHTVFVDTKEEAESFKPEEFFDTVPELVDKPHRRLKKSQLQERIVVGGSIRHIKKVEKETAARYSELKARLERRDKIAKWESKLNLKRRLLEPGVRKKVQAKTKTTPAVYKWKRVRQR